MEGVLSKYLPQKLANSIMESGHLFKLQEVHKSLAKVKFGFIFNTFSNHTVFTYVNTENGRRILINGILNGYQENPLYSKVIFMHNYKYLTTLSH